MLVFQNGETVIHAPGENDLGAGGGLGVGDLIGDALVVDDMPQHLAVRMRRRRRQNGISGKAG